MTDAAIAACARRIEELETEVDWLRKVYHTLTASEPKAHIEGCTLCSKPHHGRGMCKVHYELWRKVQRHHRRREG